MLPDFRTLVGQRDYLLEISRALTEELDLATVLERILQAAADLLGGQAGLIALREEEGRWYLRAHYGIPEPLVSYFNPLLADIPDQGDPRRFALPEVNRRLQAITQAASLGLLQGVGLPLVARNTVVGIIYVFRGYGAGFTANDRALLASFANQAAIAVNNAQLYQQTTREKRRLDAILESTADGVLIMNSAHVIQKFNRALAKITGWQPADAIGRAHEDVIKWARRGPGPDLTEAEAGGWPLVGQSKDGQTNTPTLYVEGDLQRLGSGFIAAGVTYAPLFDRENRLVNLIANVRDITRFREAEELKSTFISIISHELKTPVALIKGYAETLRRDDAHWDPATIRDSLEVISEEADRLADLIENLLDASRLQAGALKLNLTDVPLDILVTRLVTKFRTQSVKHTLRVDFAPDFPLVHGDEERLTQVLSNLLSNAIKYSPAGGAIQVRGRIEPQHVVIGVTDEGPGIAADDLPRVFDRFYRADNDLTKRAKGAGLGLFLAQAIVAAHQGRIWVESEPPTGTTFYFSLPR